VRKLIEEARQRNRRRGRRNASAVLLVVVAGVGLVFGFAQRLAANAESAPLGALPPGAGLVTAFAFDPSAPGTVYAGTLGVPVGTDSTGHVYKTTDGGQHWQSTDHIDPGWPRVDALAVDPQQARTLYAGTGVAVYKTVNGARKTA
jgi:hypothetical protein